MLRIITYIVFAILVFCTQSLFGQTVEKTGSAGMYQEKIEYLKAQKQQVIAEEKEKLKAEVQRIMDLEDEGKIGREEAQQLKEAAAKKTALNINNKTAIIDNKIALLERDEEFEMNNSGVDYLELGFGLKKDNGERKLFGIEYREGYKKRIYDRRTYSNLVLATGLNHALIDGVSFNDSPYKLGGSRFFELGWQWKTRVFKNSNAMRFAYGISYQSNGIKADNNMYFVKNGDITELQKFEGSLKKAKLRMDNLVVPVYFEIGPSKKVEREDYFRYVNYNKPVFGIGGYAGLNLSTRQKLKYSVDGDSSKKKIKQNYNTNNFIYGLAAYMGIGDTSLYVKYDLNPLFKDPNVDQNNISLGLRFEL